MMVLVTCERSFLKARIRFDDAGVYGKAFTFDQACVHATTQHFIEQPAKQIAVPKTAVSIFGKGRVIGDSPLYVLVAEKTTEDATIPPSALPGLNQPESNAEKANKKGEEAAGSNAGADAHSIKKDAESEDDGDNQRGSESGS